MSLRSALVRNFKANRENIFIGSLQKSVMSKPTLLERVDHLYILNACKAHRKAPEVEDWPEQSEQASEDENMVEVADN